MLVQQEESSYAVTTQAQERQSISSTHDKTKDEEKPDSRADGEIDFEPEGQTETAGQQTESSSDSPDSQNVQSYPEQVNESDIFQFDDTVFVCPVKDKVYKTRAERQRCRQERSEERVSREALISAQQSEPDIQNWSEREKPAYKTTISGMLCGRSIPKISCLNHVSKWCYQVHIAIKLCV